MNIYYDVEDNHYRTYPDGDIATIDQMRELIENKNLSIVKLQQENKKLNGAIQTYDILLKANVEENQQLQEELKYTIGIVEHNRIISEKNKEIHQLKKQIKEYQKALDETMSEKIDIENNWNKLKEYMIKEQTRIVIENTDEDEFIYTDLLNKMQELERSDSDVKD